jgi:hypothetical protein
MPLWLNFKQNKVVAGVQTLVWLVQDKSWTPANLVRKVILNKATGSYIMPEEYRAGQGTIVPTLFIGLGGTGSRIVDRIAGRAKLLPNWESQLRDLTNFVSIDTNELDQHKLSHIPEGGNRINISGFDKQKVVDYFRRSDAQQALQWLDKGYKPRGADTPGAGQIRVESRLGFFYNSQTIRQRLKELVSDTLRPGITWRQAKPPKYYVYIFCTLAGGTGSGSFLSVAYLIDAIIREQEWHPRVIGNLMLSTLLLDKVGSELHFKIHANTYAALKELEHLNKLDYQQVKDGGRTSEEFVYFRSDNTNEVSRVTSPPFFLSFILDQARHISLPDVQAAIADAAFLQVFTPIIDHVAEELDNYETEMQSLTLFPGELKNVGMGYTQNFGAFGAAAIVLPGLDFLEYCSLRFAAQAVRSQITFGVDPSDVTDVRARALAKLAVDYADSKFLGMSDEARERQINNAFVASVQEMARQDAKEELLDGFWYQLVESVDEGRVTGTDNKTGEPVRGESFLQTVSRKLAESRKELLLSKVSIKDRAFVFHKEGINQYVELVSRLSEDIRAAQQTVNEGAHGLETSAQEGEVIVDLGLDPISERYLAIRLLEQVEKTWIPQAEQQRDKAKSRDINNPSVRERLERELYESLQQAASTKPALWKRPFTSGDDAFLDARDEAQEYVRGIAAGARKVLDADVQLKQLRALLEYLKNRSRQYARLSTRMNKLVQDLESEAERYRRGEVAITPAFALRVEVLETLDEPRQRIWDRAYKALFVDEGRYLSTFDRKLLAETITQELKPVVQNGKVVDKSVAQLVTDLRRALIELGQKQMRPMIIGDSEQSGLTLITALELEARLIVQANKRPGEDVTVAEIEAYREKKFRALSQLIGLFAQTSSAEAQALNDGVKVNQTRLLLQGVSDATAGQAATDFLEKLKSMLSIGGKQVKGHDTHWHDPRLIIVHDVELPIPLYYWKSITDEIEKAYLRQAADERRSYNLHTDRNWEYSLPNLNPKSSELTVTWALQTLAEGLVTKVFSFHKPSKMWVWKMASNDSETENAEELGPNLSSALYRIGEFHRQEELQKSLDKQLKAAKAKMLNTEVLKTGNATGQRDVENELRRTLISQFESLLVQMGRREMRGEMTREDILDRPIFRALIVELGKEGTGIGDEADRDSTGSLYDAFSD